MKHGIRSIYIVFLLVAVLLVAAGCAKITEPAAEPETKTTGSEVASLATLAPTPVSTPETVFIQPVVTEIPEAVTPTPTPEPTEVPVQFSDYCPTINMSYEELVGSTDDMKAKTQDLVGEGFPPADKYYIIVDKYWQVVMVYMRKDNANEPDYDRPVRYMLCSTGNPDRQYGHETQEGVFQIDLPRERFYQFVNLEAAQYLTCIHSRTYFHSVLYKKKGELGTLIRDSYDNLGKKMSHACVRLTVPDARWMFYNIAPGTTCWVRKGSVDDERTGGIRAQIQLPPSKSDVRLRASEYEWTDNWSIQDVEHVVAYKYMRPRMPEGYDENGNKVETTPGGAADPGSVNVEPVPVDGGSSGGGSGGSDGDYEPVYIGG